MAIRDRAAVRRIDLIGSLSGMRLSRIADGPLHRIRMVA
jgi:hypothetical protein